MTESRFARHAGQPESQINLAEAALLLACEFNPELTLQPYLEWLDVQGRRARERVDSSGSPQLVVAEMNRLLFDELGFRGNAENYFDPRNSFFNDVIERRTGIPITLSLVYMEIGARAGLRVEGIGLPGHFIVRVRGSDWDVLVDPFNRGTELTRHECEQLLLQAFGRPVPLLPIYFEPVRKRAFLSRLLANLQVVYLQAQQWADALHVVQLALALADGRAAAELVRTRGLVHYRLGRWSEAERDWLQYLTTVPDAPDAKVIRQNLESLRSMLARRN